MENDKFPSPNVNTIKSELDGLLQLWKQNWTPIGHTTLGPRKIPKVVRQYLPHASLELEKPEEEAYEKILDYCATAIAAAHLTGNANQVIDEIELAFRFFHHQGYEFYKEYMQKEILKRVLSKLKETQNIASTITASRESVDTTLT